MATSRSGRLVATGPGRPSTYNWDLWTDGQIWTLFQGEDFYVHPSRFVVNARTWAKKHNMEIVTRVRGDRVDMQFGEVCEQAI